MRQILETRTRTYEEPVRWRTTCDRCGADIPDEGEYDVREARVRVVSGRDWGQDGGHVEGWQVLDLCDSCSAELKALLEQWGARISPVTECW